MDNAIAISITSITIIGALIFCNVSYTNANKGLDLTGAEVQCPSNKVVGVYDQYTKMIIIETKEKTPSQVEDVLLHEYKHFLDDANAMGGQFNPSPQAEIEASLYERTHHIAEGGN